MQEKNKFQLSKIDTNTQNNLKSTKNGSISLVISLISIISAAILLLISQYHSIGLHWYVMYSIEKYEEILRYIAITLNFIIPIVSLIGIAFGVFAFIKKEKNKIKPIVGILLNLLPFAYSACGILFYIIMILLPNS